MQHPFRLFILFIAVAILIGCASFRGPKLEDLTKTVESFHKDLLFARYAIAAKNLVPELRAEYVQNLSTQQLRFAEIEIMTMDICAPDNKGCAYITNQVQWYAGHSPIVKSTVITEKWIYNEERSIWQMQEQTEGY